MEYGKLPDSLGTYFIPCQETMFYQYLPIKLPGMAGYVLPQRLQRFWPLIVAVDADWSEQELYNKYVYLTAKHTFVSPTQAPNRPGWHSDGFLTTDISYLWFDSVPTLANTSTFDLTADHKISLAEMEEQANPLNTHELPCFELLRLDPSVIHRVGDVQQPGMRTFVKIVVSDRPFNLLGNSINYQLDYPRPDVARQVDRNDPSTL